MTEFVTKDSGERQHWASGMQRDVQTDKPRFYLIWTKRQPHADQMLTRYARLLGRGAQKYEDRNWEEGCGQEELDYACESLLRHTTQLIAGETDEDHAAAVWFNAQLIDYIRWRMRTDKPKRNGSAKRRRRKRLRAAMLERQAEKREKTAKFQERGRALAEEMFGDGNTYDAMRNARKAADTTGAQRVNGAVGLFQLNPDKWPALPQLSPQFAARMDQVIKNMAALTTYKPVQIHSTEDPHLDRHYYFKTRLTDDDLALRNEGSIWRDALKPTAQPAPPIEEADGQITIDEAIRESLQLGLDRDQRKE